MMMRDERVAKRTTYWLYRQDTELLVGCCVYRRRGLAISIDRAASPSFSPFFAR
jgi:hypothetical protein